MKHINFLTVLAAMQLIYLIFIRYIRPEIGTDTIDIIWSIYYYSNTIIFIILICADVIYSKIQTLRK